MSSTRLARASIVGAIYQKELRDTLRDRRTLATMLLLPMVIYPLSVLLAAEAVDLRARGDEARQPVVQALGSLPASLATALEAEGLALVRTATPGLTPREALAAGADVALSLPATAALALGGTGTAELHLYFDETKPHADGAVEKVEHALATARDQILAQRLERLGLEVSLVRPLVVERRSAATAAELGGHLASMFLPVLVLFFVALASFYPAVDLTAGEKERGTLATLLTAPIGPAEVVWGKYLAVLTVGILAGLLNVTVISATLLRAVASSPSELRAAVPAISAGAVATLALAVVLLAGMVSAVMLGAATLARSFRDASNLLAPVMMVVLAPGMLVILPEVKLGPGWAAVPIANTVLLMKAALAGRPLDAASGIVLASSLATAAVLLMMAARFFTDERVLFSSEGRRVELRGILLEAPEPGVGPALALAAALFAGQYFLGLLVPRLGPALGVPLVQLLVNVGGPLALAAWMRPWISPAALLGLVRPAVGWGRGIAAGALVGLGAWLGLALPVTWLLELLFPGQGGAGARLAADLGLAGLPLGAALLSFAALPALAEELAFRGAVLGNLSRALGPGAAVLLQAVLFGLAHGSAARFLPTATLGLALGVLARRTGSLGPGVLAHAISNALVLGIELRAPALAATLAGPTPWALLGLALTSAGLLLLRDRAPT